MRRWGWIAAGAALGIGGGCVYLAVATPIYTATAVIGASAVAARGDTARRAFFDTQRHIIESPAMLAEARPPDPVPPEWVHVTTSPAEGTITIRCDGATPIQAQQTANELANAYIARRGAAPSTSPSPLAELMNRRDKQAATLEQAVAALRHFQDSAVLHDEADRAAVGRLQQLQSTLAAAKKDLSQVEAAQAAASDPKQLRAAILAHRDSPIFADLDRQRDGVNKQIAALEPKLAEQRRTMLPAHPVLQASERELQQLQVRLTSLDAQDVTVYRQWLDQQRSAAKQKADEIAALVNSAQAASAGATARQAQQAQLSQTVDAAAAELTRTDQQLRSLNLTSHPSAPVMRVILPAELPRRPSRPDRQITLMWSTGIGLLVGILVAAGIPSSRRRRWI